jgi:hypothetical protein
MKRDVKVRIAAGIAAVALLAGIIASVVGPLTGNNGTATESDPGTSITTTTLTDDEYTDMVNSLRGLIEAADGDRCKLVPAFEATGALPIPATDAQTRERVDITAELLGAAADSMSDDDPEGAAVFNQAAADLVAEAEANDYSASWFLGPPEALTNTEFDQAFSDYAAASAEECGRDASGTTTAPPS